jgi:hypothetical protein
MGESPDLKPSVEKPVQRVRVGFVIGLAIVMTVGITVPLVMRMRGPDVDLVETTTAPYTLDPHCTPLGARRYLAETKLPLEAHAVCLALAGSTDDARSILRAMPTDTRGRAIAQIFELAHPTADAGDDRSAGPLMMLVVEFWPENYMAMFHAGMAQFALGNDTSAQVYLDRFLGMYQARDVWRERAEGALKALAAHAPVAGRQAHFPE